MVTAVLGITVSSFAVAQTADRDQELSAARGEGDPVELGERNPPSGGSTRETALVADVGNGGLVLRPSNTAKGGRAVSATCDNDGLAAEDGCAVYVNKGQGAAASFRTQGSVPFAIRDTNTGLVQHLNADMLDGLHASSFLGRGDRAVDSEKLEGNPASAFLGATSKATDAEALDGKDSSEFLGSTAQAADSNALDGKDSSEFLGSTAKAADANTLDGKDSTGFARLGGRVSVVGATDRPGFTVTKGTAGIYTVNLPAGTLPATGTTCTGPVPIITPFTTTLRTAIVTAATCNVTDGSGNFTVELYDAANVKADSQFFFVLL